MAGTFEILMVMLLVIGVGISGYYLYSSYHQSLAVQTTREARGANVGNGANVKLSCPKGKKICVTSATQVCSTPNGLNFETNEPFSDGTSVPYGAFDPATTKDVLSVLKKQCNGKNSCVYTQSPVANCPTANSQLVSTYTCVPDSDTC